MTDPLDHILALENAGWRSLCDGTGDEFYGTIMTSDARMVLANGAVMTRDDVVASLAEAPPWSSYVIDDPTISRVGADSVALVYVGTGRREGDDDFIGVMTSIYVRSDSGWKLAHYQQTEKR